MDNKLPDLVPRGLRHSTEHIMTHLRRSLVEQGQLTETQSSDLWARSELLGENFGRIVLAESGLPAVVVEKTIAEIAEIPFVSLADFTIKAEAVSRVPARLVLRYHIMPIAVDGGFLLMAADQLPDMADEDNFRMLLGIPIRWVVCVPNDIDESIKYFYGLGADILEEDLPGSAEQAAVGIEVGEGGDNKNVSITKFIRQVIYDAIQMNATDIHLDPLESSERLRYRVDGVLYNIPLPKGIGHFKKAISTSVKVMAQLDIADHRLPQDGRIKITMGRETFDVRVSILPSQHGESLNLRILNRRSTFLTMKDIGFREDQLPHIEALIQRDHGIVLITGPTGSGKTTTLYATLEKIRSEDLNIITIEDPVEYQMAGITQIQVHPQIGLTFAAGLRSILRHDPDVILIGEIRDAETADIAIRSSLTGHLVFSTLHTNDSGGAITRLLDMGIEPYLISSAVEGVWAQRLVRCICPSCREETGVPGPIMEEIKAAFPVRAGTAKYFHGRGCPNCRFTGYKGRQAICEILIMNEDLRNLVVSRAHNREIMNVAIRNGLKTLRQNGWAAVLDGTTTVEDVLRVSQNVIERMD